MAPHRSQDKAFTPSFDPACHLAFINMTSMYTLLSRSAELLELSEHTTGCHSCRNSLFSFTYLSPPTHMENPFFRIQLNCYLLAEAFPDCPSRIKVSSSAIPQHLVMPSPIALNVLLSEPPLLAGDRNVFHFLLAVYIMWSAEKQSYI